MSLTAFLHSKKVEKGQPFTHTSLGDPKGSFYVSSEDQDEFFRLYNANFSTSKLYLTEKHKETGPVLLDFDFRFPVTDEQPPTRRYTSSHVRAILKIYLDELSKYVDTTGVQAYIMEKPAPRIEKEKVKDGVHIVIPGIVTKPGLQYTVRERTLIDIGRILTDDIGITNTPSDCFDEQVIEVNNWLMYGSTKPNQPYYKVTHIYRYSVDGLLEECPLLDDETEYVELLSIRNKYEPTPLNEDGERIVAEWEASKKQRKAKTFMNAGKDNTQNTHAQYDFVQKLVDILSPTRVDSYESWIRLGWCLRNIDHRLVQKWDEFSKHSSKYCPGECEDLWNRMRTDGGLGIGTLKMWAKNDSPEKYTELTRSDTRLLIKNAKSGAHYDVAKVIQAMYGSDYVCASITTKRWYEFKKHRWVYCEDGYSLSRKISEDVCAEFLLESSNYTRMAADAMEEEEQKQLREISQKLTKVAGRLKDSSYKSSIMKECANIFYDSAFENTLNSKPNLIGFNNGVFDLDTMEFREGLPEDYLTFSTRIEYHGLDKDTQEYRDLDDFLHKVLYNPNIHKYVLLHLASCLDGRVREERFHVYTGSGANGKSKTISLFEKAFGDYACKLPISLLTNRRSKSNEASSEIARTKGRRMACLQEPSENEQINVGLMKELSGGDTIQARSIYKEPEEFRPQFKMILTCNHLPSVPADDDGTWRRIRIVEFKSRFVTKPNPQVPTEFVADPELDQKIDKFKETFMALLIEYYALYKEIGLKEPEEVMSATNEYKKSNDLIAQFTEQYVVKGESSDMCKIPDTYNAFRQWCAENYPDNNPSGKNSNRAYFVKVASKILGPAGIGKGGVNGWLGYRLVFEDDEGGGDDVYS